MIFIKLKLLWLTMMILRALMKKKIKLILMIAPALKSKRRLKTVALKDLFLNLTKMDNKRKSIMGRAKNRSSQIVILNKLIEFSEWVFISNLFLM